MEHVYRSRPPSGLLGLLLVCQQPDRRRFEYYTNDDYLTENWQPRELEHSLVSFTEWAVEGGIDHDTRRQQKTGGGMTARIVIIGGGGGLGSENAA